MKKYHLVISFLIVVVAIYTSFYNKMPQTIESLDAPKTEFSTERALKHIKNISKKPHYVGAPAHPEVRNYVIDELQKLGLQTGIHQGVNSNKRGNLCKVTNILARIKGTSNGKALLLLTHYDSSQHSSLGASDAGSGVATILEGVRAYLEQDKTPENDIIILISDGEELGLQGAELFVKKHPWADEIGVVVNFEARGSGGPSFMLIETNGGNSKLISEFAKAETPFPVGNSLAYSVYKMLPNDTDLTVFREQKNINGYNFAFIGDHFDYHTVKDSYERLDKNTLAHQGSYIMAMLSYFSESDLSNFNSSEDYAYFSVPFFKLVYFPFSWIIPLLGITFFLFIIIIVIGFRKKTVSTKALFQGFIPFLISLTLCLLLGYFAHLILYGIYPQYYDILHNFPYNGYTYIAAFALLFVSICLFTYRRFKKLGPANLIVAPIFFWLVICTLVSLYLKGASFFMIPAFAALAVFYMVSVKEKASLIFITLLGVPIIWILIPLIQIFPVGLGFKMNIGATAFSPFVLSGLFTVSSFGLLLGIFHRFFKIKRLSAFIFLVGIIFFASAHFDANFTKDSPQPSSLVYLHNANTNKSYWATYDHIPNKWVNQYLEKSKQVETDFIRKKFGYRNGNSITYAATATIKKIAAPEIVISKDTIIDKERFINMSIKPRRNVNRLSVYTEKGTVINACEINGSTLTEDYLKSIPRRKRVITHFVSHNDPTEISMALPADQKITFHFYESSYDLLTNELFSVPARPENSIPKPFRLNDAIITKKTIHFE